jgi:hypothetical protein
MARTRLRIPRAVQTGSRPHVSAGAVVTCVVLGENESEWFGLDLATGAFVRVIGTGKIQGTAPGAYRVVEITIGGDPTSIDPARPELLVALPVYNDLGVVKKRRFRWLLDNVAATDRPGATVLGTRGPSVAYVDLDGTHASVTMIEAKKANLELLCDKDTAMLAVTFGGVTQRFPVYDERTVKIAERIRPRSIATAALGAEIGYKVGYVLIALSAVEAGHVRKAVFALLPRSRG